MHRKKFIQQTLLALPAFYLGESLLFTSCKKKDEPKIGDWKGDVLIIGAGIAGLYAAQKLMAQGISVTILEAGNYVGGRIRTLKGFADHEIELGAEEVHGKRSEWYNLVSSTPGAQLGQNNSEDYYYIDNQLKSDAAWSSNNNLTEAKTFESTARNYSGADKTVYQEILDRNIHPSVYEIVNAMTGNEYGTSSNRLSILGITEEDQLWNSGNQNYELKNSTYSAVLQYHFGDAINKVQLNKAVKSINYSGAKTIATDANGTEYIADKVLVTVPLSVLKAGDIHFSPSLPESKRSAMEKIGMGAGMKIILKFNNRFWPSDTGSIIGGSKCPEYWFTAGKSNTPILTAFIMGEKAEYLSGLGNGAIQELLKELDTMYGNNAASNAYSDAHITDWGKEQFFKGAYSYPVVGGGISMRAELARAVDSKIYFAGEATHTAGHSGTVHGALETAIRSVTEITGG